MADEENQSTVDPEVFKRSDRKSLTDHDFKCNVVKEKQFSNYFFKRVGAKGVTFESVDFSFSTFDSCYFRQANFKDCKFIGCRFISSNFRGAKFEECRFDYATFERTILDHSVIDAFCTCRENVVQKFARSLRANFQSLGDPDGVNKAIRKEITAEGDHLLKVWHSDQEYYRTKVAGFARAQAFLKWVNFKIQHHIWGNGESCSRLIGVVLFFFLLMAAHDALRHENITFIQGFRRAPHIFFGNSELNKEFAPWVQTAVVTVRLIIVGLFLSVWIKRANRR